MILDYRNGSLSRQLQHPDGTFFYTALSQDSQWFLVSLGGDGGFKSTYFILIMRKKFRFRKCYKYKYICERDNTN